MRKASILKTFPSLVLLLTMTSSSLAQVGISTESIALEDNNFIGIIWEPEGDVTYSEKNGQPRYGFLIAVKTSDNYLAVKEGNKVSIEYTDDTREVVEISSVGTYFSTQTVSNSVVSIYRRNMLVYPDFGALTTKLLKRIVIQRNNGNTWIINTTARRAKKILKELPAAMKSAEDSYKQKAANDSYFDN